MKDAGANEERAGPRDTSNRRRSRGRGPRCKARSGTNLTELAPGLTRSRSPSSDDQSEGLALDLTIAPDVPAWVTDDPTRLPQILLNLLTNALKFTERGRVGLTVLREFSASDDVLRFEISDTGVGIAPESQHLLFQTCSIADCREAGMDDHLAKPIDRGGLRKIVATWATRAASSSIAAVCPSPDENVAGQSGSPLGSGR